MLQKDHLIIADDLEIVRLALAAGDAQTSTGVKR